MEIYDPSIDIEFMPIEEIKKNVLSYYDMEILQIESVKFKDTDKQRAVYKVFTDKGCKCLKKVYYDKPSLLFIYSVIEWLNVKKILCPRLISNKRGLKYVEYNGNLFILMDWIDGRKCNYDDINDIVKAAENLGRIHHGSRGFNPIEGSNVKEGESDYFNSYNKHFIQLLELSNKAYSIRDKYSKAYIDQFDYYIEAAKESVYLLSQIDFSAPLGDDVSSKSICHLDYVNKNLIFTPDDDIYIIDFDKCSIDMPVHDITSFLRRILKRKDTAWDFNIFRSAIESYERVRLLSYNEHLAMLAILMFPQKYWKVSRDYYKNRHQCNKDAFLAIIKKIGQQQKQHYIFCNSVREYIECKF
jgi:CotS family spore coat protein